MEHKFHRLTSIEMLPISLNRSVNTGCLCYQQQVRLVIDRADPLAQHCHIETTSSVVSFAFS
jgi:hypothetical protein